MKGLNESYTINITLWSICTNSIVVCLKQFKREQNTSSQEKHTSPPPEKQEQRYFSSTIQHSSGSGNPDAVLSKIRVNKYSSTVVEQPIGVMPEEHGDRMKSG